MSRPQSPGTCISAMRNSLRCSPRVCWAWPSERRSAGRSRIGLGGGSWSSPVPWFFGVYTGDADSRIDGSLILLQFVSGLGRAGVMPNAIALTWEFCPRRRHGTMVMVMNSGLPRGSALGGFAAAPIIPAYDWRSVFILGGILPLILVPLLIFLQPESIRYLLLAESASSRVAAVLARMNPQLSFSSESELAISNPTCSRDTSSGLPCQARLVSLEPARQSTPRSNSNRGLAISLRGKGGSISEIPLKLGQILKLI
jgi:MFS family permease